MEKVDFLKIPNNQKDFLKKLLLKAGNDEKAIFAVNLIIKIIQTVEVLHEDKGQEILKGAHILIENPELFLNTINSKAKTRHRISSHYRDNKTAENGINLPSNADFLVGLATIDQKQQFWMQLENTKVDFNEGVIRGAILLIVHILDYLYYKYTGKNVGPCGLSEYIESNPIKIGNVQSLLDEMKPDESKELPDIKQKKQDFSFKILQFRTDQSRTSARAA